MGECGCAVASLWLGHAPSIGLAIGPRHAFQSKAHLPLADRKSNTYNFTLE